MKEFLVIWYGNHGRILATQSVRTVRIFFAQDEAMMKVIDRDSKLWEKLVKDTLMVEIREILTDES